MPWRECAAGHRGLGNQRMVGFVDYRTRVFIRQGIRIERARRAAQTLRSAFRLVFGLAFLLLTGGIVEFVHRTNYTCAAGDRIIQSETEAIKQAQIRIIGARYGSHGIPGYVDDKPGYADFSQMNCCTAARTRTIFGVIVWEVTLRGETLDEPRKRYINAQMALSNCGTVFAGESFIEAVPGRQD